MHMNAWKGTGLFYGETPLCNKAAEQQQTKYYYSYILHLTS